MSEPLSSDYWEHRYREGRTGWDRGAPSPALLHWLATRDSVPHSVLVPGCGAGHEVAELARRGIPVTGLDYADSAIAQATSRLQRLGTAAQHAVLVQTDLFAYQPPAPFAAVYEQTCLCAISPSQRAAYETQLHRWLQPGGELLLLAMQTDRPDQGPPFHCPLEDLRELFPADRWRWSAAAPRRVEHPGGPIHELACQLWRL